MQEQELCCRENLNVSETFQMGCFYAERGLKMSHVGTTLSKKNKIIDVQKTRWY